MKKQALDFGEGGPGYFTLGCKTAEEASTAMQELWNDDKEYNEKKYGKVNFAPQNLKQDLAYEHKICHYYTIGENWCCECGENTKGKGRTTFTIFFTHSNQ